MDLPVGQLALPKSSLTYSTKYLYWKAARHAGYTYEQFADLPGPQQSGIVAFYSAFSVEEALLSGVIPG